MQSGVQAPFVELFKPRSHCSHRFLTPLPQLGNVPSATRYSNTPFTPTLERFTRFKTAAVPEPGNATAFTVSPASMPAVAAVPPRPLVPPDAPPVVHSNFL